MSTNGSPPKTTNMASTGGLFGSQQCPEDNVGAWDNNAGNTPSKDTQFGQPPNQCHPPPGYSYPPSQPPFPGAHLFYHPAPFNMTPNLHPSSAATQRYPSYGPLWQGYDFPQGGYGGPQMFPPQQCTGQAPSSPGAPRVPPATSRNIPVLWPTPSASTPYGPISGTPGRPPISLARKRLQLAAELRSTDVAGIANFPHLQDISYDKFDADCVSDDSSDLGGAQGKDPVSVKQMEFSLKQFAEWMGQPTFGTFNKWKKLWVAGFLEKRQRSIIPGKKRLKQLRDGPLHWEMAVANRLQTFKTWLRSETFDSAKWIWWQWFEMFLKKCASEVWEARKKGTQGDKWQAMDLGEHAGKMQVVTSQSCQIQLSWLWFVECRMTTMTRDPEFDSKLRTELWGTGRSWLF